jgi:Domain of unknown function (DUF4342)
VPGFARVQASTIDIARRFGEGKGAVAENTCWESFKVEGTTLAERIKALIREGNVRRVVVEHDGRTVAEFPLTAGVLGVVVAPVLAAVGALLALLKECTIHVERGPASAKSTKPPTKAAREGADAEC